ncbi:MAG TPA: hypothetical protein VGI39_01295 [Polyangiaceae bacterium]|jgi:hypothetical protein
MTPPLRLLLERSWQSARMQVQRHTVPLNVAAAAGQLLTLFKDAQLALDHVEGADDWAVQVRSYLRHVIREELIESSRRAREATEA